jgi:hypothetical protein
MIPEKYYDLLIGHRLPLEVPRVKCLSRIHRISRFRSEGKVCKSFWYKGKMGQQQIIYGDTKKIF